MHKETMTSRERVLAAFAHAPTDRVPIDYQANPAIHARLKAHYNVDNLGLLEALWVDYRTVGPSYKGPRLFPEVAGMDVNAVTGYRTRWTEHKDGGYWEICDYPLQDADMEAAEKWPVPSADDYDYESLREQCRKNANYATCLNGPPDIINNTGRLRTMEQVLIDLVTDDEAGLLIIKKRAEAELAVWARALEYCNKPGEPGIAFLFLGEDLGTQRGPTISLPLFHKHILPYIKAFADLGKAYNIPCMMHSCGSSSWAFDDINSVGVTAVDALQPEATNMEPAYLKEKFGDRLMFHGCISTAGPLAYGTVEDVKKDCRDTLEIMMPGGGYTFAPTHMIQDNSPTENVVAMYETGHELGWYK